MNLVTGGKGVLPSTGGTTVEYTTRTGLVVETTEGSEETFWEDDPEIPDSPDTPWGTRPPGAP